MIKLTNWYFTKGINRDTKKEVFIAEGTVSNHPKLEDGIHIHTSIVEKVELDKENNRLLMYTHSKNTYELLLADMNFEEFEKIKDSLECFNVSILTLDECQKLKGDREMYFISLADKVLQKNELYLAIMGVFVQRAFFKNDAGEIREIRVTPHISMFQDSYLITDWEKGEVDFRYFDGFNTIKPYHWSDGLSALVIENVGSTDIEFLGSDRKILCKSGEVTRIENKEYHGEGLFSPDVVNGKSLFSIPEDEEESCSDSKFEENE